MTTVAKQCEICGRPVPRGKKRGKGGQLRFCSFSCRNTNNARQRAATKGRACSGCGKVSWVRKGPLCRACSPGWSPEDEAYIRARYPEDGATAVALALNMPRNIIIHRANKLGVRMTKETTHRLNYDLFSARMKLDNPMRRDDVKAKARKWWAARPDVAERVYQSMLKGQQAIQREHPSKLELRARAILISLGIEFEPSALIKPKFIVDIRIGSLIIQIDGEYWHGHPRYEPLSSRQEAQRRRDQAQDAYLTACGYTVVRIWDRDVTTENLQETILNNIDLTRLSAALPMTNGFHEEALPRHPTQLS